jgi:putative YphP/YqiW family bacilliredoxin
MYPEDLVAPMRHELTSLGVNEMRTPADVDDKLKKHGTTFLIINSVCGCAAGNARPAVRMVMDNQKLPDQFVTVFAGQDKEATQKAREFIGAYPPSSPSMFLFKNGELEFVLPRHQIESRTPEEIASDIKNAFDTHCS